MFLQLLFSILFFSFQQQEISVIDEKTNNPLELVHLTFYKNGKVLTTSATNEKGLLITNFAYDSLRTSILGYESKTIKNLANNSIVIKLSESILNIEEVVLTNSKKTKIIGDWNTKGKKDRGFYTKEVYSILIENNSVENYKPISLLVNFKEVPKKAVVAFKFYSILIEHHKYFDQIDKEIFYLDIKIPSKDGLLGVLEFELARNTVGIYEFDLSTLDFDLPKEGFLVSPMTLKVFDDEGEIIKKPSNELIPKIYSHKTELNNLCEKYFIKGVERWRNIYQERKKHRERHPVGLFPTTKYYTPTIALKAEVLVE
uniref:hypothetical protein n=1 Tax=Flavobacterium sp. TaxID=239 RepID=UPI00404A1D55